MKDISICKESLRAWIHSEHYRARLHLQRGASTKWTMSTLKAGTPPYYPVAFIKTPGLMNI